MAVQIDIHEATGKLFELGEKAWAGDKVIITINGNPHLELRPCATSGVPRKPGRLAGKIHMAGDFDESPGEIIDAFEGRS